MIGVALVSFFTAFSGAVVPGTLFALTVNQALQVGWMAGVWIIVGHMLAELTLVVALRLGLNRVLQRNAVTRAVGVVGGLVLLYFAWGMIALSRSGSLQATADGRAAMPVLTLIAQGALVSILNPYWSLWWATVGVGLIAAQTGAHGPRAYPPFFIGHIPGDFTWYIFVAAVVAFGSRVLTDAVHRGLIFGCGVFVAVLGVLFLAAPLLERRRAAT